LSRAVSSLKSKAVALLARREHSRAELRRKLAGGDGDEHLDEVLDDLAAKGWQSDQRFANAYVADHKHKHGRFRLAAQLRERGVDDALIEQALAELDDNDGGDELSRARAIWRKKFAAPPGDRQEYARQARFLQSRGFDFNIIRTLLGGADEDD
jgi:regulatory protein